MAREKKAPTTDAEKVKAAYAFAQKTIREKHLQEFYDLQEAEAKRLGVEWHRPLTDEQKAEAEVRKLAEKFPDILARVQGQEDAGRPVPTDEEEGDGSGTGDED